jgi:hypothetical protein
MFGRYWLSGNMEASCKQRTAQEKEQKHPLTKKQKTESIRICFEFISSFF